MSVHILRSKHSVIQEFTRIPVLENSPDSLECILFFLTRKGRVRTLKVHMNKDEIEEQIARSILESQSKNIVTPFALGLLVATPCALKALLESETFPEELIYRHGRNDWGEVSEHDAHQNYFAIRAGLRILSAYKLRTGKKIWIITEGDRSSTTLLLPEEY